MNQKQFERKVEEIEKMLDDLQGCRLRRIFRHATDEEMEAMSTLADALRGGSALSSISEGIRKAAELAFERMQKRAKDSSRPHSRKLLPYLPSPKEVG